MHARAVRRASNCCSGCGRLHSLSFQGFLHGCCAACLGRAASAAHAAAVEARVGDTRGTPRQRGAMGTDAGRKQTTVSLEGICPITGDSHRCLAGTAEVSVLFEERLSFNRAVRVGAHETTHPRKANCACAETCRATTWPNERDHLRAPVQKPHSTHRTHCYNSTLQALATCTQLSLTAPRASACPGGLNVQHQST